MIDKRDHHTSNYLYHLFANLVQHCLLPLFRKLSYDQITSFSHAVRKTGQGSGFEALIQRRVTMKRFEVDEWMRHRREESMCVSQREKSSCLIVCQPFECTLSDAFEWALNSATKLALISSLWKTRHGPREKSKVPNYLFDQLTWTQTKRKRRKHACLLPTHTHN